MELTSAYAVGLPGRRGQAMVETCLVVVLLCLMFLGLFQVLQAYAFHEVLDHAAARAGRARAVGFNDWMVFKCMRVAAIPNAGRLVQPVIDGVNPELRRALADLDLDTLFDFAFSSSPVAPQADVERNWIPDYLDSPNASQARQTLDYEDWPDIWMFFSGAANALSGGPAIVAARVRQDIPLMVARADMEAGELTGADPGTVGLVGRFDIEQHYSLYLDEW